jgi:hypothetical protein
MTFPLETLPPLGEFDDYEAKLNLLDNFNVCCQCQNLLEYDEEYRD